MLRTEARSRSMSSSSARQSNTCAAVGTAARHGPPGPHVNFLLVRSEWLRRRLRRHDRRWPHPTPQVIACCGFGTARTRSTAQEPCSARTRRSVSVVWSPPRENVSGERRRVWRRPTSHCSRRGAASRPGSRAAYDSATRCVALLPREHPAQLSDMGLGRPTETRG